MTRWSTSGLGLLVLLIVAGWASTPDTAPAPGGITLREDDDLDGGVWLAAGFGFRGYATLYIAAPQVDIAKPDPGDAESIEWAKGVLRDALLSELGRSGVFRAVVARESDIRPGSRVLRFETAIIDYAKGGGAGRWFGGEFGLGQPMVKVRGVFKDGATQVCVFEARRRGESIGARLGGAFRSNRDIQREDIRDLAEDLTEYVQKISRR